MVKKGNMKKVHILVEEDEWLKFLDFVRAKRGKVKGVLWEELKNAIRCYEGKKPEDVEEEKLGFKRSKTLRIVDAIGHAVLELFKSGKTVSLYGVEEWIRLNVSPNKSTVNQYMEYFRMVYVWDTWEGKYIKPWTFHRKDSEPFWSSEKNYLNWLRDRGISTTAIEARKKLEKEEIESLMNAEIAD